jgi:inosine-uridine nucleoside N-ribohydrolase
MLSVSLTLPCQVRVERVSKLTWGMSVGDFRKTKQNQSDRKKNVKIFLNVDSDTLKARIIDSFAHFATL